MIAQRAQRVLHRYAAPFKQARLLTHTQHYWSADRIADTGTKHLHALAAICFIQMVMTIINFISIIYLSPISGQLVKSPSENPIQNRKVIKANNKVERKRAIPFNWKTIATTATNKTGTHFILSTISIQQCSHYAQLGTRALSPTPVTMYTANRFQWICSTDWRRHHHLTTYK